MIYTKGQWAHDRTFKAEPGQQISSALLYDPCRIYEAADQLPQEPK